MMPEEPQRSPEEVLPQDTPDGGAAPAGFANAKDEEIRSLVDRLQRLQAEFENYRKRILRDLAALEERTSDREVLAFLPLYDNLERAFSVYAKDADVAAFVGGVERIFGQFAQILDQKGVRRIPTVGERFDPALHEALLSIHSHQQKTHDHRGILPRIRPRRTDPASEQGVGKPGPGAGREGDRMREKIIGIDLGTTFSCVAVLEGGSPTIITNSEGERITPSVVAFTETGERLVGRLARRQAITNPKNTISSIKRQMGTDHRVKIQAQGKMTEYSPEQISAMILQKLKQDAEAHLGGRVGEGRHHSAGLLQ